MARLFKACNNPQAEKWCGEKGGTGPHRCFGFGDRLEIMHWNPVLCAWLFCYGFILFLTKPLLWLLSPFLCENMGFTGIETGSHAVARGVEYLARTRQNCSPNWESAKGPSYKEILGQFGHPKKEREQKSEFSGMYKTHFKTFCSIFSEVGDVWLMIQYVIRNVWLLQYCGPASCDVFLGFELLIFWSST